MTEIANQPQPLSILTPESMPSGEYAIVEMLGHRKMVGRITEAERFGATFLSIEPLYCGQLLNAVLVAGASLFQVTPCTAETALTRQARYRYDLPPAVAANLPADAEPIQHQPAFLAYDEGSDVSECAQ